MAKAGEHKQHRKSNNRKNMPFNVKQTRKIGSKNLNQVTKTHWAIRNAHGSIKSLAKNASVCPHIIGRTFGDLAENRVADLKTGRMPD